VHDGVDPHLAPVARDRAGEKRRAGREECLVFDPCPVDVGVRTDQYGVAEHGRVSGASTDQGAFHDHDVGADPDFAVFAVSTAPCRTRTRSPDLTSPQIVADGAT